MYNQQEIKYIIRLLKCAVSDDIPEIPNSDLNWELIYRVAIKHKITSTLYFGIMKLPKFFTIKIPHIDSYLTSYKMNLVTDTNRTYELQRLKPIFEDLGIDYIFLKGSVIKELYPNTSMRRMNDIDILFRGTDFKTIDKIFEELGYEVLHKDAKDTAYLNPTNKVVIEMQPHLIDKGYTTWYEYLENVWDKCNHENHEYQMSLEDFYIYHIIHMAKHFKNGGIGLTHLVDVYIMLENFQHIDWNYVENELSTIKLLKFHETIKLLVYQWFGPLQLSTYYYPSLYKTPNQNSRKLPSEQIALLTKYIFNNGAFGSRKQQEINSIVTRGDEKFSFRKKFFPNMTTMINYFGEPLRKHKYLLPLYWIKLNIHRLLHYSGKTKTVMNSISAVTETEISNTKEIMTICGLE